MKHELKIEREYLENLLSGRKRVEIRYNDRDYQKDDILEFWHHGGNNYLGSRKRFLVTHIHSGLGMKEGFVALSVMEVDKEPTNER